MKTRWTHFDKGWIMAALLPLIGIIPAWGGTSVINTADGLFHVHRIFAMTQLMDAGNLYPRWIPWFHLGYGYPVFNFYSPAASYLGGLLGILGFTAPLAYTLIASLSWIGGSMGMYGLARRYLPTYAALVAAALWVYAPSRLQDVWNIGNLSQIIGTALVPWLFLALARAIEQPSYRHSAALALLFAAIILAHQPTTVLVMLFIIPGLPLMALWSSRTDWKTLPLRLLWAGAGLALGGAISLIFALPLFLELDTIKASLPATDIPSVLLSGFLQPSQLFQHAAAPDLSDISRRLPDTLGLVGGLLAALGFIALLWKRRLTLALAWGTALAFCLFLMLDISLPVWLAVPLLDQLRFPARVLRVAVVFLALLGGSGLLLIARRYAYWATGIALLVVIGTSLPTIYPSRDFVDFSGLTAVDEIEYELDTYAFGGTSYDEFKPVWATRTPYDQPPDTEGYAAHPLQIEFVDPALPDVEIESIGDAQFRVSTPDSFELSLRHFYFPGWSAWVDDAPAEVFPKTDLGLLTLNVPSGEHIIRLAYTGTVVQNLAPFLTLAALALVAVLYWKGCKSATEPAESLSPRFATLAAGTIIAFAALNTIYIAPQTGWFRQQSPLDAPAAMQTPVHVTFGDAYELLGYTLHQNTAARGEAIPITLFWRALRPLDHDYRPQVQLVNPRLTEAWATNEGFFVGSAPINHTPDYFVSDVHLPRVFENAPPYVGYIAVKLIDSQTDQPLLLTDGSSTLMLDQTVRVNGDNLPVNRLFDIQIGGTLELWCASFYRIQGNIQVDFYWHVIAPYTPSDLRTFVHGLDEAGNQIEQSDVPPFAGDYAPKDWLPGQTLVDTFYLPYNPDLHEVAAGLYVPDGDRLPATQNGQPAPDNRVMLPLVDQNCFS